MGSFSNQSKKRATMHNTVLCMHSTVLLSPHCFWRKIRLLLTINAMLVYSAGTASDVITFPVPGWLFMDSKNVTVTVNVSEYYLSAQHSPGEESNKEIKNKWVESLMRLFCAEWRWELLLNAHR